MAELFDGTSARPEQVRVLLFNKQIHIYSNDTLISSVPTQTCTVQNSGGKVWVYLTPDSSIFLTIPAEETVAKLIEKEIGRYHTATKTSRSRLPFILSIIAGAALFVFVLFSWVIPAIGMRVISVEVEKKLGNGIYTSLMAAEEIDTIQTQYVQQFADQLRLSRKYKLHIVVTEDKQVNAFALPGGTIIVTTGILKHLHSPEELAALLSHEATHVNNRHSLRSILKDMSVSFAISMIFGRASELLNGAAYLNQLSYSRSLEEEADEQGIELLCQNHVNPIGMVKLMEDLKAEEKIQPISFLSTHPLTEDRLKAAQKIIRQLPAAANYPPRENLELIWKEIKQEATYTEE